ncbi:unnamed protein product, partial [Dovyalis caffra]
TLSALIRMRRKKKWGASITRQREELQQMKTEARAQVIARFEIPDVEEEKMGKNEAVWMELGDITKCYKVFDLDSKETFLLRDLTFYEDNFPFHHSPPESIIPSTITPTISNAPHYEPILLPKPPPDTIDLSPPPTLPHQNQTNLDAPSEHSNHLPISMTMN